MNDTTEFARPTTVTEYNALVGSIPPVGVWMCGECSESLDPFEGAEGREWDAGILDSSSNYHKYPEASRMSCEWCGAVPRDMIYRTFAFPAED